MLIFINPKSGGKLGTRLLAQLRALFHPSQIYDLTQNKNGPGTGLLQFRNVPRFRILVCGGDGTVGWVLATLDELDLE